MKKIWLIALCVVLITCCTVVFILRTKSEERQTSVNTATLSAKKMSAIIPLKAVGQYPELPTGCESAATVAVLRYFGENITALQFAENWLYCEEFYSIYNTLYGPDPNTAFAGDPTSYNAYGCYENPIITAVNENSQKCSAKKVKANSLEVLCKRYIDNGTPVIVWATMDMNPATNGNSWVLPNGKRFEWTAGEHCLVLVGYTESDYIFADPRYGENRNYQKNVAEERFAQLEKRAVVVTEK